MDGRHQRQRLPPEGLPAAAPLRPGVPSIARSVAL